MLIKNVTYLNSEFEFEKGDILFDESIIKIGKNLSENLHEVIDGNELLLVPGFIDIHTHGAMGYDTCDGSIYGYAQMAKHYARHGVTSFLFTTMTLSEKELSTVVSTISNYMNNPSEGAYPQGIYMEGPFINESKKGAQNGTYIANPDLNMFKRLNELSRSNVRIVTIAPEQDGSLEFIDQVKDTASISIAHTASNYDTTMNAISHGASGVTHMYNAMPAFSHREPGVIGAAFDSDSVYVEIICDGIHLHPATIRTTFKVCSDNRVVLVSDSMSAAGMEDGKYSLGGQNVFVKGGAATLSSGTIAGSTTNLHTCIKNCISYGIKPESVFKAASINPAKHIGVDKVTGSIAEGKLADLVLMNTNYEILKTFVKGK